MSLSSSSSHSNLHVPKFPTDVSEFADWVMAMKSLFMNIFLWSVVDKPVSGLEAVNEDEHFESKLEAFSQSMRKEQGAELVDVKQEVKSDSSSSSSSSSPSTGFSSHESSFFTLVMKSRRAYHILYTSLNAKQKQLISHIEFGNAHAVWKILIDTYGVQKNTESAISLITQLTKMRQHKGETVSDYIARILKIRHQLMLLEVKTHDAFVKAYILLGLENDQAWSLDISMIKKLDHDNSWTVEKLQQQLVSDEKARNRNHNNNNDDENISSAHIARSNRGRGHSSQPSSSSSSPSSSSSSSSSAEEANCSKCGRDGHTSDECYAKKPIRCTKCGGQGHISRVCPNKTSFSEQGQEQARAAIEHEDLSL